MIPVQPLHALADRVIGPSMKQPIRQFVTRLALGAIVTALASGPSALAQSDGGFSPVDQTVADLSPLSASLQLLRPDFGPPQGFNRVYTHPDYPGRFLRVDGAIVIEFPHSEYLETEDGIFAPLPEGAVFWIGGKPDFLRPEQEIVASLQSPLFVNGRMDTRAATLSESGAWTPQARQPLPPPARPTVWSDEQYRRSRLEQWMNAASESDRL